MWRRHPLVRLARPVVCAVVMAVVAPVFLPQQAAAEITPSDTGLHRFGDMEVSTSYAFVASSTDIVVMDLGGHFLSPITPDAPVGDMMVHEDTLFVTHPTLNRIDAYDISGPQPFPRVSFATTPATEPYLVLWAGGQVWFTWSRGQGLASLDPTDATVNSFYYSGLSTELIDTSPGIDSLFIIDPWDTLFRIDVGSGTPEWGPYRTLKIVPVWMDVSPNGDSLFIGTLSGAREYETSDLSPLGAQYEIKRWSRAGAVDPSGARLAMLADRSDYNVGLELDIHSTADASRIFHEMLTSLDSYDFGIRYSPDGSRLFLALTDGDDGSLYVASLPGSPKDGNLVLLAPSRVSYRQQTTITAHLGAFDKTDNDIVRIYMQRYGGTKQLVAEGEVNQKGNITYSVILSKNAWFWTEWDGDSRYMPATESGKVTVDAVVSGRLSGAYGSSGKYKLYHSGDAPVFVATVRPNHAGRYCNFELQRYSGGRWRSAGTAEVKLNDDSKAGVRIVDLPSGMDFRVRAEFDHDADHGGDLTEWFYFRLT